MTSNPSNIIPTSTVTPSSSSITPNQISSSVSLSPTIKRTAFSKITNLVEYTYIPKDAQISETDLPLVSSYNVFKRHISFKRSIQKLINTPRPPVKEYVQCTGLDNCLIQASIQE
ncbi:hypothetical protein ACOSP7_022880 [Xanthoceras sorbifolium]